MKDGRTINEDRYNRWKPVGFFWFVLFFQNKTPTIIVILNNVVMLLFMGWYVLKAKILNINILKMR